MKKRNLPYMNASRLVVFFVWLILLLFPLVSRAEAKRESVQARLNLHVAPGMSPKSHELANLL